MILLLKPSQPYIPKKIDFSLVLQQRFYKLWNDTIPQRIPLFKTSPGKNSSWQTLIQN